MYIHTHIQTPLAFNTLMWGSLRLAPITNCLHDVLPIRLCTLDNIFCKHLMVYVSVSCCVFYIMLCFYIMVSCCVLFQNQLLCNQLLCNQLLCFISNHLLCSISKLPAVFLVCSTSKSAAVFYIKISYCVLFQIHLLCSLKSAAVFYFKVSCCVL